MTYRIAASLLSADFARLGEEVRNVIAAGADSLSCGRGYPPLKQQTVYKQGYPKIRLTPHSAKRFTKKSLTFSFMTYPDARVDIDGRPRFAKHSIR